jgi:hypothetical protein
MMAIFGALLPRFVLLVAWSNDGSYWGQTLFGGPVLLLGGFLFFPWTTLIYGLVQPNGLSILNLIFIGAAFLIDLGTWGIGAFATKKQADSYMGS